MAESRNVSWDDIFRSVDEVEYYEKPPNPDIVVLSEALPPCSTILDLGCGMGGSDIHLAKMGHKVRAVDFSECAIGLLRAESLKRGVRIDSMAADLAEYNVEGTYDAIIAHGIFQFLNRIEWERLISEMKEATRPSGLNLVAVFTDAEPVPEDMKGMMGEPLRVGELFELYRGWDIIMRESYLKEDEHPGGIRHRHPIEKVMARKRNGKRERI